MPSPLDDIKARLDLVELVQSYIRLHKAGVNYKAVCPFHSEKTPSFVVSPARQIWHCFGCGKGGSHIDFVKEIEGVEFREALELLAKRAGVTLKREDPRVTSERTRLSALMEDAARLFESLLHAAKNPEIQISPQLAYLKKRGLADETIKRWRIGFAPDSWDYLIKSLHRKGYRPEEVAKAGLAIKSEEGRGYYDRFRSRIIFPIADASGRIAGFGGRVFEAMPGALEAQGKTPPAKYINTPQTLLYDKSRILYGFDKARDSIRRQDAVVLVEGYMDCVMSHQAGVANAVAVSGTALSVDQLRTLKRLASAIISSFDADAAGEMATKRSLDLAAALGFERKVAALQGFKDPADAALQDPAIWQKAVEESKPIVQFYLERALAKEDAGTAAGKRKIAQAALPEIKILSNDVERAHWIQKLSEAIRIPEDALWQELKKSKTAASDVYVPAGSAGGKSEAKKTRRDQLEALLVGTFLLYPEERSRLGEIPRHAISKSEHQKILELLENTKTAGEKILDEFPEEYRDIGTHLAFQAEILFERIENASERSRELALCIKELEREWARERMKAISQDIAAAEASGEKSKLEGLLEEFKIMASKVK